jgi:hypothetical protein
MIALAVLMILVIVTGFVIVICALAPEGYEDDSGFHRR